MNESFIHTIVANPEDDAPRLVYADWLDETGDPANADRAEFIRLQCRLETLPARAPERPGLEQREKSLLSRYARIWAEPFRQVVNWWTYRRGFIESASVKTEGMRATFGPLFRELVEGTPLREVILFEQTDDIGCLLAAAPLMTRLRSFSVRHGFLYTSGRFYRTLFASPHFAGLTRLELEASRNGSWFRPRILSAILQLPTLNGLTELYLSDYITNLHPTVLRTIARSPTLANLTRLSIESTTFDRSTIRGILRAAYAQRLEVLELRSCRLDGPAWEELLSPESLPALKRLFLCGATVNEVYLSTPGTHAELVIGEARSRFGPDAIDIEREYPDRPFYYSWWQG